MSGILSFGLVAGGGIPPVEIVTAPVVSMADPTSGEPITLDAAGTYNGPVTVSVVAQLYLSGAWVDQPAGALATAPDVPAPDTPYRRLERFTGQGVTLGENPSNTLLLSPAAAKIDPAYSVGGGTVMASSDNYDWRLYASYGALTATGACVAEGLMVGGGGAGGRYSQISGDPIGGGGGAGGVLSLPHIYLSAGASPYAVVIGSGGLRAAGAGAGNSGGDTTFAGRTAKGGGGGGQNQATPVVGAAGGSGGGGAGTPAAGPATGGSGYQAQGNAGGAGVATATGANRRGGGGGGFLGAGTAASAANNGNGGAGIPIANFFGPEFAAVASALGLINATGSCAAGGGGGTGATSSGTGGLGGAGGGGTGGNGSPVYAASGSSWGCGGGGGGDNIDGADDKGGSGYQGMLLVAIPRVGASRKLTLWFGDDVYRDDDGNTSAIVALVNAYNAAQANPRLDVGGFVFGDCKVGAQWFCLNPDQSYTSLPSGYNDGDSRYPNTAQNKVAGGNRWFHATHSIPAIASLAGWNTYQVYEETPGSPAVHEWNFTGMGAISAAATALVASINAAIADTEKHLVVYSAGGGANVPAEALAKLLADGVAAADIAEVFAIVQHGRNNWALGYDVRGGIDARNITRPYTIAVTNQNETDYGGGAGTGPDLENAFLAGDIGSLAHANTTVQTAIRTAVGQTAPVGVPGDSTFSATLDASDAGSHAFALSPGRVVAALPQRMLPGESLEQTDTLGLYVQNLSAGAQRDRVMWRGFRRNAILPMFS